MSLSSTTTARVALQTNRQYRMTEALARIAQTGLDIFGLEIWELPQNLSGRKPRCQQLQFANDTNAHPAHAGLPATLFWVDGYPLSEFSP